MAEKWAKRASETCPNDGTTTANKWARRSQHIASSGGDGTAGALKWARAASCESESVQTKWARRAVGPLGPLSDVDDEPQSAPLPLAVKIESRTHAIASIDGKTSATKIDAIMGHINEIVYFCANGDDWVQPIQLFDHLCTRLANVARDNERLAHFLDLQRSTTSSISSSKPRRI